MAKRRKQVYKDGQNHTSYFPSYYPKQRDRMLAFLLPIYDPEEFVVAYYVCTKEHKYAVADYEELVDIGFRFNLDIYTHRLFGKNSFIWFSHAIKTGAEAIIVQSTKSVSMLSVKGTGKAKRRVCKIISTKAWGYDRPPDHKFIVALDNIFTKYGHGVQPSASSLGYNAIIEWHKKQGKPRYYRPPVSLRHKLYKHGSGGRVDDFDLYSQLGIEYQSDINNSYGAQSIAGVPVRGAESIRLVDWFTEDLSELQEYKAAFCQSRITIPDGVARKFSPFYIRTEVGSLEWQNKPGVYYGWYWSKMLKRCLEAGYKVEIAFSWCWRELDTFLAAWVLELVAMREYFREQGLELEEEISKRIIVSAIGRFAMKDIKCILVDAEHRLPGDEQYLDLDVEGYESMLTIYFVREIVQTNANHLTQVAYFIIMQNNVELYDRCLAEEAAGNVVLRTYFDMVATTGPPTQPVGREIGGWKLKQAKVVKSKHTKQEVP